MPRLFPFNPPLAYAWRDYWAANWVQEAAFPGAQVYRLRWRPAGVGLTPGLPGVQELIAYSLKRTATERGAVAAAAEAGEYARAYGRVGAVRDLARFWSSVAVKERGKGVGK